VKSFTVMVCIEACVRDASQVSKIYFEGPVKAEVTVVIKLVYVSNNIWL